MDIKQFVEENKLQDKDIVNVVQSQFPGYHKTIHSKVKRPDEYGITLIDTAEQLIRTRFASGVQQAAEAKKKDRHRLPCRVSCRLTKREKRRLQQAFTANGHSTIQDGMKHLINRYLGGGEC